MSRIYFHSEHETVEVYGSERAHMSCLCKGVASGVFDMLLADEKLALIPKGHWARQELELGRRQPGWGLTLDRNFGLMLSGASDERLADGTPIFGLVLNTVLAVGSPALQLCARLHGQCEIHAYVEQKNSAWLAQVIEEGLESKVLRDGLVRSDKQLTGWRDVIALLGRAKGPVVTSYSVCEEFPNSDVAAWTPPPCPSCKGNSADECEECGGEPLWDLWYDLPDDKQWSLAMAGLRKRSKTEGLELRPGKYVGFDNLKSAFDYMR